uniref:Uncharacterized protein n=1 Tax=Arundo donax TaxID=35708 RepID=A0A0A8YE07_ARUDO
MGKSTGEMYAL